MRRATIFVWLTFMGLSAVAQQQVTPPPDTSTRVIIIVHTDQLTQITRDSIQLEKLIGHDTLYEGRTKLYADSMYFNQRANEVEAFGTVHINDNDSVNIYSRYLKYFATPKKAILRREVRMTDGKNVLTTDSLDYDLPTHVGTYIKGGKVVNGTTTVTSVNGLYNGNTKDVIFSRNVHLVDTGYRITNDSLIYNMESKVASWAVPTVIDDGKSTIHTKKGYYDLKHNLFYSEERPRIDDSAGSVIADRLAYDKISGEGEARGNVIYKDTSSNTVLANHVQFNRQKRNLLATEKPVLILLQGKDTTYVAADTFYSDLVHHLRTFRKNMDALGDTSLFPPGSDSSYHPRIRDSAAHRAIDESTDSLPPGQDSTLRFMIGFHHVRVFSDSLQAKSDSLFYSDVDSVFRFFSRPVIWANHSQISGDTMYLYTKHQAPTRLYVFNNGFIINKVSKDFYNQIQSRTVNGYFKDGAIDYMRSKGNAHSVYFAQNDSLQFLGLSLDEADAIDLYFLNRELHRVVYRNGVKGTTIPMGQIQIEQTRLPGFKWYEALRPKSKEELFQ
ncbi:MAG TPA: OstA-like protein [Dinghuibacter sp.]|uniref:OstA-like protein n=1 Tax=Dinghuibacter sp. TaxID=2024697 RepID=UPI002CEED7BC|nr:OstA-like protein [Dinghuibacter sp.]HTJ12611.1 OstA-like protein [Dinghuibacter sp.]